METALACKVWKEQSGPKASGKKVAQEDFRTLCLYFVLIDKDGKCIHVGLTCTGTNSDSTWEEGDICLTGNVTNPARVGRCLHVHDDGTCNWILIELKETFLKTGQYDIQTVPFSEESPTQGRLAIRTASDEVSYGNAGETYGSDWFQVIPSGGPGFTKSDSGSIVWAETTSSVTARLSGVIGYHSRQSPVVKSQTALVSGLDQYLFKEGKEIAQQYVLIPRPKPATPTNPPYYTGRCKGDEYKNDSEPRGRAIIINNEKFSVDHLPRRHGTQVDVDALRGLFSKLHYDVEVIKNLEASDIKEEIERESRRKDHYQYDSFILFLLSHGSKGVVYGTDGYPLPYDTIKNILNNKNCPGLRGKPKMIFIQACQGTAKDSGALPHVQTDQQPGLVPETTDFGGDVPDAPHGLPEQSNDPTMADFLVVQATSPEYVSWRHPESGTWFVQSIVKIFTDEAHRSDVLSMLLKVNDEVSQKTTTKGSKQASVWDCSLRKKVFFNITRETGDGQDVPHAIQSPQSRSADHPLASFNANTQSQSTDMQSSMVFNPPGHTSPSGSPFGQVSNINIQRPVYGYYGQFPQGYHSYLYPQGSARFPSPSSLNMDITGMQYPGYSPEVSYHFQGAEGGSPFQTMSAPEGFPTAPAPNTFGRTFQRSPTHTGFPYYPTNQRNQPYYPTNQRSQPYYPTNQPTHAGYQTHGVGNTSFAQPSQTAAITPPQNSFTPPVNTNPGDAQSKTVGCLPQEMQYHARLAYLVQYQGTRVFHTFFLRDIVKPKLKSVGLYNLDDPEDKMLKVFLALSDIKNCLTLLKKPKGKVLFPQQYDQLYPSNGQADIKRFDISLLFILIRNLHPNGKNLSWVLKPGQASQGDIDHIIKIKDIRNKICHDGKFELDEAMFEATWRDASGAIMALGGDQDEIDWIKMNNFNEEKFRQLIKSVTASDQILEKLDEILMLLRSHDSGYDGQGHH